MKQKILLIALAGILFSCSKSKINDNLEGSWVSADNVRDTIYFYEPEINLSLLDVKRSFTNGIHRMPNSGQYAYKLKGDSINPQFAISSAISFKYYYFKKEGDFLTVGNFFAPERSHLVVKFKKISN